MNGFAREASDRLLKLLSAERAATLRFVTELAEFHRLRQWESLGYASLFDYLTRVLGLHRSEAFYRMKAAELLIQYPQLVEVIGDGRIALSSLPEIAHVITPENCAEVLPQFFGRSVRESKVIAAGINLVQTLEPTPAEPKFPLMCAVPMRVLEKLKAVKAVLSHKFPMGDLEDILEAGLDALLEKNAKAKAVKPPKVAKPPGPKRLKRRSPPVPVAVRREIWTRDKGVCQWPLELGGICASTYQIEGDHIVPDGPSTPANMRLLCRIHNDVHARQWYGDAWMDQFVKPSRSEA